MWWRVDGGATEDGAAGRWTPGWLARLVSMSSLGGWAVAPFLWLRGVVVGDARLWSGFARGVAVVLGEVAGGSEEVMVWARVEEMRWREWGAPAAAAAEVTAEVSEVA